MTTVASATGVRTYHTLASVAGAPHEAFSCASSASVVASVVLSTSLNGTETTVAPENRSEEHTSELQSSDNLVCRLLLEKKKAVLQQRSLAIDFLLPQLAVLLDRKS